MNAPFTTEADISRALLVRVVNNPSGKRPRLEITTPERVFHLVTVEEPVLSTVKDGKLTFISFFGRPAIGRIYAFMWPSAEDPAFCVTELGIYE
ncbi:MAG TPA: hypothetical protein DEF00_04675 [Candidatus Taylorbacteria bacterium]|nr:MAG: hypothetical protein UY03_C0007G0055 [Parcubacteria group bacterium GW2011_GWA2_47_64]KKU95543.1 MAG: hypothetical protein UY29_C0024G0019 [Parcubacteria group bacterium GW2011_GWC2_48_17]HBV01644.1 hypothetical protein [Candidatus Taylorbacteria bacterium]